MTTEHRCPGCDTLLRVGFNYCDDWSCSVRLAERDGGKKIAPNGLPITVITRDGTMLEHEHANDPNYKFPVTVECIDEAGNNLYVPGNARCARHLEQDSHAFLGVTHDMIHTMFEYNSYQFRLDGTLFKAPHWDHRIQRIKAQSLVQIREWLAGWRGSGNGRAVL